MSDADMDAALVECMTTWRREFHATPELGFAEHRTAARVAEVLRDAGLEVHEGLGGTGVVGVLQRGNATRCIALRADMDALPIHETGTPAHVSRIPGVMHACGHDGHMAMLLGAAVALAAHHDLDGRIVFLFQPAEEHGQGAQAMLADAVFDRFGVDEVHGMHNIPGMELGTFATRKGPITASESLFEITVNASGGHAAMPHMGVDAITVGAQIVGALQTIVSRKLDPGLNGVVSVTGFETDGMRNVLPGRATLTGDTRALSPAINSTIEARMRQITAGICQAHDVRADVSYETIFTPTLNAPAPTDRAIAAAAQVAGAEHVDGAAPPKLFSEDFAHFAAARPGCFILMGNGTEGASARSLHASDYEFNDAALPFGAGFWTRLAASYLQQE